MNRLKYFPTQDYSFLLDENHYVYDYFENEGSLHIYIKSKEHGCCCPICGKMSHKLHATYRRKFQDTPIRCKQTFLHANVYKYDCENPDCEGKVFMEKLPFAKASQVRTDALNTLIFAVSMFLSNEGASKVLALLGVQISNDTIQRLYDRIEFIDNPDVEGIGVDDVAIRKGQTYATAIYDLKDHHLIALLDGRDGEPLKEWLKSHNKVRLVARDRASAYASAISEILPDCVQVADRFHLLQNLLEYMKDIFKEEMPAKLYLQGGRVSENAPDKILREKAPDNSWLDSLHYDNTPPRDSDGNELFYDNKRHDLNSAQYQHHEEMRKKTAINPGHTGILGQTKETTAKKYRRNVWNIITDSKEISGYDPRRSFSFVQSRSL